MSSPVQISEHNDYFAVALDIREHGRKRLFGGGYERIIFTNGCFDVLHPGHIAVLKHAHSLAGPRGAVVVGMNDDESVKRLKGEGRPIFDKNSRGLFLASLRFVDYVVAFSEDSPLKLIEALQPDVIVKGGDYKTKDVVGSHLALVSLVDYDSTWSTTQIIERMKKNV